MKALSLKALAYLILVVAIGLVAILHGASEWEGLLSWRFALILGLAITSARWKVSVPSINGNISVLALLILFGVVELPLAETLVATCFAAIFQCTFRVQHRPKLHQVIFNISVLSLATACGSLTYRSPWMHRYLDGAPLLLLTASVFFLLNTSPIAGIIAITEEKSFMRVWKEGYFWSFPFYLVGGALAGGLHVLAHYAGWQTASLMFPVIYIAYRSYHLHVGRVEDQKRHAVEISSLHLRTIETLALAIEAKDQTTATHLARVQIYAMAIGKELGMNEAELAALQAGALLHDIGKLAVPEHIISKPGKLTREEFEKMKIHPVVGAELLERVQFPYPVTPIVRSHHEKWNGEGYPDGLKGEQIPLGARILAAVDCLDALASDRQYRKALPLDEAMAKVAAEAGTSFDPKVVEVLSRRYRELEAAAQAGSPPKPVLSVDLKVERGEAPAAGLAIPDPANAEANTVRSVDHFATRAAARQELQNLFELIEDLGSTLSLHDSFSLFAARLRPLVAFDCLAIYLVRGDDLLPQYVSGESARYFNSLKIRIGEGLSGWVAETHKTILNGNPAVESGSAPTNLFTTLQSALSIPLELCGRLFGVLTLYRAELEAFCADELDVVLSLGTRLAEAIDKGLQPGKEAITQVDSLTGLANVRGLFRHLDAEVSRCKRVEIPLTVLAIDLTNFRSVNDRLGHSFGNEMLVQVALRLQSICRPYDYVARTGGDEFVIILPELSQSGVVSKIEQVRSAISSIPVLGFEGNHLEVSIGGATFGPDGWDADQLLTVADQRRHSSRNRPSIPARPSLVA